MIMALRATDDWHVQLLLDGEVYDTYPTRANAMAEVARLRANSIDRVRELRDMLHQAKEEQAELHKPVRNADPAPEEATQ